MTNYTLTTEGRQKCFMRAAVVVKKKRYVLDFLKSKDFTLSMEEIENLIEAAVLEPKYSGANTNQRCYNGA